MMKVFDYTCSNCSVTVERITDASEIDSQECDKCQQPMAREFPAPKGYVRGTSNPVSYKPPRG